MLFLNLLMGVRKLGDGIGCGSDYEVKVYEKNQFDCGFMRCDLVEEGDNETQWFWRRSKTPLQWLLCFPLGTRPSPTTSLTLTTSRPPSPRTTPASPSSISSASTFIYGYVNLIFVLQHDLNHAKTDFTSYDYLCVRLTHVSSTRLFLFSL
ncbi:hypothetical protein Fmac_007592 [Flemingia macrophylla]|uniref:Uncharacterized protein n=1 Tax=Flemingia macrophylla TaxID=520843 RepID=A0ABD1MV08_9FABA